ncbi:MAG: hypothetical protein R3F17_12360 [Planctomycetota bacterium]
MGPSVRAGPGRGILPPPTNAPLHGLLATLSILLFACACTPAADTPAPDQTPPPVTPEKKQTPPLAAFDGARAWRDLGTMVAPGPGATRKARPSPPSATC